MKWILFGLLFFSGAWGKVYRQEAHEGLRFTDSVRKVIDSSIVLLRTHALHRDRPDWDFVRARAYELAGQITRWEDLGPAASWLFESVGDHHGWLAVGDTAFRWQQPELPYLSDSVRAEFARGPRIVRRVFAGGIGYLRVPSMVMDTAAHNRAAQQLMDSLCALEADGARKIILDLRLDAGGTMFPMIAGVSPLLGNGSFVGDADARGIVLDMTSLRNGRLSSADGGSAMAVRRNGKAVLNERTHVVVLTGHGTGSAGECLAVAFKGRRHTRFIGEPTAGFMTGNNGHWIIDGQVGIVIGETVLMDRDHRVYQHQLIPDEWTPGGDDFTNLENDKKIQAALRFLY